MGDYSLKDKNIIVVGASSGIGRECAIQISKLGANLILIGRNIDQLNETLNNLEDGSHLIYSQDITDIEQTELVVNDAVSKLGKISGVVYSAGIEMTKPLKLMIMQDYINVFMVNTFAAFELARIVSKKKNYNSERCSIVFISSVMGSFGQPGRLAYSASKGALLTGTKSLALELVTKNITVNTVSPAFVETSMLDSLKDSVSEEGYNSILDMHPKGFGKPNDVASLVSFLLSDSSQWITGTDVKIDGGYSAR